jgi:hypothetical protein
VDVVKVNLCKQLSIAEGCRATPSFGTHGDTTALKLGARASIENNYFASIKSLFELNV